MNNLGSINHAKEEYAKPAALTRINVRRLINMLEDTKVRPPWFKDTKRSRQRWRSKPGGWNYDPVILKAYHEALAVYRQEQGKLFAEAMITYSQRKGFMRTFMDKVNT